MRRELCAMVVCVTVGCTARALDVPLDGSLQPDFANARMPGTDGGRVVDFGQGAIDFGPPKTSGEACVANRECESGSCCLTFTGGVPLIGYQAQCSDSSCPASLDANKTGIRLDTQTCSAGSECAGYGGPVDVNGKKTTAAFDSCCSVSVSFPSFCAPAATLTDYVPSASCQ